MMKYLFVVILLHQTILKHHGVFGAPDNKGSEYIIGYMENIGHGSSAPLNPELYVTTMRTTTVNVRVKAPLYTTSTIDESFTVTAGVVKKLTFNSDIRVTGDVLTNKGIWVIADDEIVIYGVSPETYSNDAFLGLPTDVMDTEYYIVTWWPPEFQCELMVVGINDSTTVNIRLSQALGSSTVTYNGVTYNKGDTITVTMNRYQTLQLTSGGDLTGTYITSDKIISVFSGNKKAKVDSGTSSDHLVEQWPPVLAYGKTFITIPIPGRTTGDKFKFVASENNTHVTITGNSYSDSFTLAEPGSHEEKDIPSGTNYYCYVQSDKPILVVQFCKSQASYLEKADPMMTFIPPIKQYAADYTFATPQYSGSGSYTNYFMFVVKDAQKSGLLLDGSSFPGSTVYTPVPGTDFVAGYIQVSDGTHTIRHASPISVFGGYLYGTATYESYGFPTGSRVAPINTATFSLGFTIICVTLNKPLGPSNSLLEARPCYTSTNVVGDGLDNDCDGLIDEELCPDGNDDDGDGSTDEDCATPFPIDGSWTAWTSWSCTVTCSTTGSLEHGTIIRTRTCTNPLPQYDGKQCSGDSNETQTTCSTSTICPETTTEADTTTTTESTTIETTTIESTTQLVTTTESTTESVTTTESTTASLTTTESTTESVTTGADTTTTIESTTMEVTTKESTTEPVTTTVPTTEADTIITTELTTMDATTSESTTEPVTTTESTTDSITTTESTTEPVTTTESTTGADTETTTELTRMDATTSESTTEPVTTTESTTDSVTTTESTTELITTTESTRGSIGNWDKFEATSDFWSKTATLAGMISGGSFAAACMCISFLLGLRRRCSMKSKKVEPKEAFKHDFDVKNYDMRLI